MRCKSILGFRISSDSLEWLESIWGHNCPAPEVTLFQSLAGIRLGVEKIFPYAQKKCVRITRGGGGTGLNFGCSPTKNFGRLGPSDSNLKSIFGSSLKIFLALEYGSATVRLSDQFRNIASIFWKIERWDPSMSKKFSSQFDWNFICQMLRL